MVETWSKRGRTDHKVSSAVIMAAIGAAAIAAPAPSSPAQASVAPQDRLGVVREYNIAPGTLGGALNEIADQNHAHVLYPARATRGWRTEGLFGAYSLSEALDRLLAGTSLTYRIDANEKSVSIVLAQADNGVRSDAGAETLPTIDIGSEDKERHGARGAGSAGAALGPGDRHTGYKAENATSAVKMDMPILKTPVAVQVVTRQTMDDQQAISVRDAIITNVSSVQAIPSYYESFKVRGFSSVNSTYKNGLLDFAINNLDTTNLQSIEVVKGPASVLFGRIEPGGLINLVVKRPLATPYYSVQEQVGSFGLTRTTLDATGPLTADHSLLYRFNGVYYHTNSYRNFVTDENVFLAPTVSIHPIEQFRMNIDFEYQHRSYVNDYPLLPAIGGAPAPIPLGRYLQEPFISTNPPNNFEKKRIAYDWTFDFAPDWSLTNRLSYTISGFRTSNSFAGGFNPTTGVLSRGLYNYPGYTDKTFATNLDLKGKIKTGPLQHTLLVGVDHFDYDQPWLKNYFTFYNSINIYSPTYWRAENPYGFESYFTARREWTGVYGQDVISALDDTVNLVFGGRYDWAETSSNTKLFPYSAALASYTTRYDTAFNPRIALSYQPLPWLTFYGNFARSMGANNGATGAGRPLAPQRGEQFEGGVKAEFFDRRLTATFAYYDIVKTNIPTPDSTNPLNTLLIGKARSRGVELDVSGRIDDNWSVIANYSHDDVRVVEGSPYDPLTEITTQLAVAGNKLPASPRNYGNLWVRYDADGLFSGLSLAGGVTVVESALGDNANSYVLPAYTLLNGMIAYRTKLAGFDVTAQLNVKNLTNETYYLSSLDRFTILTGTPRTFLGSLRVEF